MRNLVFQQPTGAGAARIWRASRPPPHLLPSDFNRVTALGGHVAYGGGAIQFVPGEGATLDGTFQGPEQNQRKYLAIGEALQPHLAEQPGVFAGFGLATLQGESDRGGDEINYQENCEIQNQLNEVGRVG